MSVSAQDFLTLAFRLASASSEIEWRSGVSRAYYSCFHLARETSGLLPDNSHFVIDGGTHTRLIDRFRTYKPSTQEGKKARQVAYVLTDLKKRREKADYDISVDMLQDDAKTAIETAQKIQIYIKELASLVNQAEMASSAIE